MQDVKGPKVRTFKDLIAWQKAMDLAVIAHRLTHRLPKEERYALADQIRRSSSSVPANIAEGTGGGHTSEYLHSLSIADRSLKELETHLILGLRFQYFRSADLAEPFRLINETGRLLGGLTKSLKRKEPKNGSRPGRGAPNYSLTDNPLTPTQSQTLRS